jgi:hypothetical protein
VELAALANKVVIADQVSMDQPDGLLRAAGKVAAYVGLGLQLKSSGQLSSAVGILRQVYLEQLFRLGHTRVARVRSRLQEVLHRGWLSQWPAGLRCLDPEWLESAELLLEKTPKVLRDPGERGGRIPKADLFRNSADLHRASMMVDMISTMGVFFDSLNPQPDRLDGTIWRQGHVRDIEDVTIGMMIWTACANFLVGKGRKLRPIPLDEWPRWFPRFDPAQLVEALHRWVDEVVRSDSDRAHAQRYMEPIFRSYEQEMAPFFHQGHSPDPQLVRFFLFTEARDPA